MPNNCANIRHLVASDRAEWLRLWHEYCRFYRAELAPAISARTFDHLCTGDNMLGLVCATGPTRLAGFMNIVFHASTWSQQEYCYLEDLYVDPNSRGNGVAEALFESAYAEADRRHSTRVYWHTQQFNAPARSLYDKIGLPTSFIVYRRTELR